jgi:hypothetical protein
MANPKLTSNNSNFFKRSVWRRLAWAATMKYMSDKTASKPGCSNMKHCIKAAEALSDKEKDLLYYYMDIAVSRGVEVMMTNKEPSITIPLIGQFKLSVLKTISAEEDVKMVVANSKYLSNKSYEAGKARNIELGKARAERKADRQARIMPVISFKKKK